MSQRVTYLSHRFDRGHGPRKGETVAADTSVIRHKMQGQLPDALLVFTPEEAADILRISRATLYRRVREGKVDHRMLGDGVGVRFSAKDLEKILKDGYRPAVGS